MERTYLYGKETFVAPNEVAGCAYLTISRTHKIRLRQTYQQVKEALEGKPQSFLEGLAGALSREVSQGTGLELVVFEGALLGGVIFDRAALRSLEGYLEMVEIRLLLDEKKRGMLAFYSDTILHRSIEVVGFNPKSSKVYIVAKELPEIWEELRPLALAGTTAWLLATELGRDSGFLSKEQHDRALSRLVAVQRRAEREVRRILKEAFSAEKTAERWARLCGQPTVDDIFSGGW